MPVEQIIAFMAFSVVAAVTPGPSTALVMIASARAGFYGGLPCAAGVVVGMALMMGLANYGLGGILQAAPGAVILMKAVGAVFLLWLAWKVGSAPPMTKAVASDVVGFWQALLFQWINPKSWIVSASAAATYGATFWVSPMTQALWLSGVFFFAATLSCILWLAFGATLQILLVDKRRSRWFNVTMGIAFAGSVIFVIR